MIMQVIKHPLVILERLYKILKYYLNNIKSITP